jgi:hypothetical protein
MIAALLQDLLELRMNRFSISARQPFVGCASIKQF